MSFARLKQTLFPALSLTTKLILLYALTTVSILMIVCFSLYSTFIEIFGQDLSVFAAKFCYHSVLKVLLLGSLAAVIIGVIITRKSLHKIKEFSNKIDQISVASLDQRVSLNECPVELKEVAARFNGMLDRIQSSFNQLSDFSSDIAHELRGPIHNLKGVTEVALTSGAFPETHRHILDTYMQEYEHLSKLIENLLFLARSEHGQLQLDRKRINAAAEINHVCDYYQAMALESGITLTCEGEGDVWVDPTLFKRVISNLLSNALRYTGQHGQINISIRSAKDHTKILIRDSGVGIASEHLSKIFDRFYRVDASRTLQSGGMGLGLAIVKSIIDLHEGAIHIQSQLNVGTTVTMMLPI